MNRSGDALPPVLDHVKAGPEDLIVIYDDLALPLGRLRVRQKGSAGGHNGIKSIISALGSDQFLRIRIGIEPEREIGNVRDFVLSRVASEDRDLLERAVELAARAVESLITGGLEKTMAAFNGIDLRKPERNEKDN
jgi:PTH1 family peptidyl-tRNA hydrolase